MTLNLLIGHTADMDSRDRKAAAKCRPRGLTKCNGRCVDTSINENHCGNCKTKCSCGQVCFNGLCKTPVATCIGASTCENIIPCGSDASCICWEDVTGAIGCYPSGDTCVACQFASDCTAGANALCLVNTCCFFPSCVYPSATCGNLHSRRNMFRVKRDEGPSLIRRG